MTASGHLTPLEWDSAFLGFPTGRLDGTGLSTGALEQQLRQATSQGWHLVYWFVQPEDAVSLASAQAIGATLIDDKCTYARGLDRISAPSANVRYIAAPEATADLMALALQSGAYSRFRVDPRFAPNVFVRLYTQWIQHALNGAPDRQVLVYGTTPTAPSVGLLTLEKHAQEVRIGLLAVDSQWRQRGIGHQLVEAAAAEARAAGYTRLKVTTQAANQPACHFYERCGFTLIDRQYVFHLWLTPA
ncbi:GNAT family N-acetyltransferase [Hymenobacter elongatus]|uniref:GNAT family N-acetyltransferase n=1 Tax=Hymenobacter elongatus TaxID=877208 RepID=A0A4Z0PKB7_9BACT|nr:GNAT family N-acetyltransferase [Hymenobacter elongatus]TGE15544.1 GNAT family N-acetyltransferase [Hymenobacter elongatus]